MKYKQTEIITYTDKTITDDSWNIEDECIFNAYNFLMYALQKRLNRRYEKQVQEIFDVEKPVTNLDALKTYFSKLLDDTLAKVEEDTSNNWLLEHYPNNGKDDFIKQEIYHLNTVIYERKNADKVLTTKAVNRQKALEKAEAERKEKERMLLKAKELAKAELLREQEILRLEEEAEVETNQIVFPLKNYGK